MNRDLAINSRPASAMAALPMASKIDTENIQPTQQHCNVGKQQISSPAPPPEVIEHRISENGRTVVKRYYKGELLGKGGFAKCFLFTDCESNERWACKVRSCPTNNLHHSVNTRRLILFILGNLLLHHKLSLALTVCNPIITFRPCRLSTKIPSRSLAIKPSSKAKSKFT